jgi:hypothetical protein
VGRTDSGVWVDLSELHQSLGMFGQVWGEFAHPWGLVGLRLGLVGPWLGPVGPPQRRVWSGAMGGLSGL